jgi:hypothetical protein
MIGKKANLNGEHCEIMVIEKNKFQRNNHTIEITIM